MTEQPSQPPGGFIGEDERPEPWPRIFDRGETCEDRDPSTTVGRLTEVRQARSSGMRIMPATKNEMQRRYPGLQAMSRNKDDVQNEDLLSKLQECQAVLKEVELLVPGRTAKRIKDLLQDSDSGYVSKDMSRSPASRGGNNQDEVRGEQDSSPSSVGSLEDLDQVKDDVNRTDQSRATGHIGKSSDITWMQRLQEEAEKRNRSHSERFDFSESDIIGDKFVPHEVNYHLDDFEIEVSEPVQMYWLPPRPLADKLFETYLQVAHPYFPIINRPLFCHQYRTFFDSFALPGDKWMAILNIIFAIAANYAHSAGLEWYGDDQSHLLFLTRARMLSMSGSDLFRHPDLQQVQVEGLTAFYLLSTDQINRAWRISALAIRSAVSLGINLKNCDPAVSNISKEVRNRVWWSLYMLENKLGLMTGRPTCISVNMCSSPFPLPFEETQLQEPSAALLLNDPDLRNKRIDTAMASSFLRQTPFSNFGSEEDILAARSWLHSLSVNAGLYFLYSCDLTMMMQELLDCVYSLNSVHQNWKSVRTRIDELQARVDVWFSSLPPGLDFTHVHDGDQAHGEKMGLAFQYHSARIMLGRPCLCRHTSSQRVSDEEQHFSRTMAISALKSATQMANLIPDGPSTGPSHGARPWWCLLHYVMQAATIMILELSFGSIHMPEAESSLLQLAKKCVRWLHGMSEQSVASHRAWQLCDSAFRRLAKPMGFDVSDLSSHSNLQKRHEGHTQPVNHAQMCHRIIGEGSAAGSVGGANANQPIPLGSDSITPGNHPPIPSNAAGHEMGEDYSAYDPISEFAWSAFPELEDRGSWIG
ncbi:hypothetical protein N7510_010840 [Penicillium lagena]|uniref:uncharacterized protein n=1 Tax=Penicillium lagena TaxID=94218 RepID=UPI002540BBAD|nr:uncharacterized protein N7510_010840 [Penicillium lagena]KAJ5601306.1 hypothetical protein N7510_010840 [Penicillium lagena]